MTWCKRTLFALFLLSVVCSGQSLPSNLTQRIDRQLRVSYDLPDSVTITISPLQASDFPNYDALTVTLQGDSNKKTLDFLLSKDQKTLIRVTKMDLSKDPYAENMKKIDVKGRPVRGNPNAKVVVVSYDDFECPFCSRAHQILFPELLKEYGDRVTFIYKDFPLSDIHPWATHAAVDANCLAAQSNDAYWAFADYIHANQSSVNAARSREEQFASIDRLTSTEGAKFKLDGPKLQECVKAQKGEAVTASVREGDSLGVDGTPTMFINGKSVNGVRSADELRTMLDAALLQAGVAPPVHPAASENSSANSGGTASAH